MKLIRDKILIRISAELRESIYSKEITDAKGNKIRLWKEARELDQLDERASFLNVQTGIVEDISDKITWIKKGDIALINYDVCNSLQRFAYADGDDNIYWLDVNTTYHEEDEIVWQNQKTKRNVIVHSKNDYDELSGLLGVIRENELIANAPYIFFKHESNIHTMVSPSGLMYDESKKIIEREIIAISEESSLKYGLKVGDLVTVDDYDLFSVKLDNETAIDCINDCDPLMV
jgi:hypothetical protein